jgi:hypothetical protein
MPWGLTLSKRAGETSQLPVSTFRAGVGDREAFLRTAKLSPDLQFGL